MQQKIMELLNSSSSILEYSTFEEMVRESENQYIEFKALNDLRKLGDGSIKAKIKDDISRYVSAFSNYSGGILAYGVTEGKKNSERHIEATGIRDDIVSGTLMTWLSDVVASSTEPIIRDFCIKKIPHPINDDEFYYLIIIGASEHAPHQAKDLKYYGRFDHQTLALRDWFIRDILNRRRNAEVKLKVEFRPQFGQTISALRVWPSIVITNDVVVNKGCMIWSSLNRDVGLQHSQDIPGILESTGTRKKYRYHPVIYPGDELKTDSNSMELRLKNTTPTDAFELKFVAANCRKVGKKYRMTFNGRDNLMLFDENDNVLATLTTAGPPYFDDIVSN